ncbi:HoxA transcriptional regulator [Haloarcula hispanica N601]|uniref:DNA-binding response regulator n=2 Tax=Haloarcula hispanica TaxID=51589 RepID=A0A482TD72_HALHI|nr:MULTISPECIES: response regulator [Haloarcula]AHB65511.1 HoxA transcriptional regulator [Haloarcula hispanica N601]AJF26633.1 HoxA transcriptional regulator [Haloarcula sp. CBA1115]KAA9407542.1 DNA-binding response regulator [Haloarcula sp. CBA1131]KAA9409419.1 DNA-binding response regulator [Haloarcula hispanica]MCJ0618467.1 response regulator transcription factor [Haloarcula hispanica]
MGRPTSVAVIDDDTDYRQLYKLWLPEEYEVIEAGDGRTGLQRIDDSIDAVLLDRQMPKLSGETVAEKLRQRSVTPAVVMISSVKPDVDILDIPVDSYLRKPADRDTLVSVLSAVQRRCEYETERRELLGLADRRDTVADAVRATALAESDAYKRAVERLEQHDVSLADAASEP